jgi:heptaprenylglyceryl phosphate synthase
MAESSAAMPRQSDVGANPSPLRMCIAHYRHVLILAARVFIAFLAMSVSTIIIYIEAFGKIDDIQRRHALFVAMLIVWPTIVGGVIRQVPPTDDILRALACAFVVCFGISTAIAFYALPVIVIIGSSFYLGACINDMLQ